MFQKVSRITIALTAAEHKRIRMAASQMETTIKDLLLISFENFMHRKTNRVTEKAINSSQQRTQRKKFKNLAELFEDLGI